MRGRNRVRGRTQRAQRDTQRAQENTRNGFCWAGMRGQIRRGRKGCAKDAKNTNMGFGWLVGWLVGLGWFGLVWFGLVWFGLGWVGLGLVCAWRFYALQPYPRHSRAGGNPQQRTIKGMDSRLRGNDGNKRQGRCVDDGNKMQGRRVDDWNKRQALRGNATK